MRSSILFFALSFGAGLFSCSSNSGTAAGTGGAAPGTGGVGVFPGTGGAPSSGGDSSALSTGGGLGVTGGATGLGGSGVGGGSVSTGGVGDPSSGGTTGGAPATGGSSEPGGGTGGAGVTGGVADSGGGSPAGGSGGSTGGSAATGGSAGGSGDTGGTGATGGAADGGAAGESGSTGTGGGTVVGPGTYALPPPSQCHNEDDYQGEGCIPGDANSLCGGKCNVINACQESSASKPGADTAFICPRFMLFSPEMMQAATDDGNSAFNYAIVGHDVDSDGIDTGAQSTCCQCYQLVYAYPSPANERQVLKDPNSSTPESAITLPKPLIVQSFNTAATPHTFDVYMGAGGLGANNACAPVAGTTSASGEYLYTAYPEIGQPGSGGVKPVTHASECKNSYQWVTQETISSEACQDWVTDQCTQIQSDIPGLAEQAQNSCIQSNNPDPEALSFYHMNWSVYVMKVECPQHLTEVTGCRLEPQSLSGVDRNTLTAQQAELNPSFGNLASGSLYETTTMEDCCRPSCASTDWIIPKGLVPAGDYNAFYSCDVNGVPYTEPE